MELSPEAEFAPLSRAERLDKLGEAFNLWVTPATPTTDAIDTYCAELEARTFYSFISVLATPHLNHEEKYASALGDREKVNELLDDLLALIARAGFSPQSSRDRVALAKQRIGGKFNEVGSLISALPDHAMQLRTGQMDEEEWNWRNGVTIDPDGNALPPERDTAAYPPPRPMERYYNV